MVAERVALGRSLTVTERAAWLHRSSRRILERLGIPWFYSGNLPQKGILVSNHLSYLDVLLFSAAAPCLFVSKSDVRLWPIFGALAAVAGTLFIDRRRRRDAVRVNQQICTAQQHVPVVLFPEGTSSDGLRVLPFRSALFESASSSDIPIIPAFVSYSVSDGLVGRDVCYWGDMNFALHLLKLLGKKGVEGKVQFGEPLRHAGPRKIAARVLHDAVVQLSRQNCTEY